MKNLFDRAKLFFSKDKEFRAALYNIMGFYPHNIELYRTAFAHKSLEYRSKKTGNKPLNNERLEFLGDAVLETVVSDIVYRHFPNKREGFLTNTRSKIVSRESLGRLAKDLGIDRLIQSQTHSRAHNSYLGGNSFEALMGAIYLDRGFAYAFRFVEKRIIGAVLDLEGVAQKEVNFKSKLLEWGQKNKIRLDFKENHIGGNNGNQPSFHTTIVIEGVYAGDGKGFSKKESHQAASKDALTRLRREPNFLDSVFRAKEKRTAMSQDEFFVLPKIDEIEAEIAKPRAKSEKQQERPKRERNEKSQERPERQERKERNNDQKPKTEAKAEQRPEQKGERNEKNERKNAARPERQEPSKGEQKPKPEQNAQSEAKPEGRGESSAERPDPKSTRPDAKTESPAKEKRQKAERPEKQAAVEQPERVAQPVETPASTDAVAEGVEMAVAAPAEAAPQAAVLGLLAQLAQAAPATAVSEGVAVASVEEKEAEKEDQLTTSTPKEDLVIVEDLPTVAEILTEEQVAPQQQAERAPKMKAAEAVETETTAVEAAEESQPAEVVAAPEEVAPEKAESVAPVAQAAEEVEAKSETATETTEEVASEATTTEGLPSAETKAKKKRRKAKRQSASEFTNTTPPPAEQSHRAEKAERRVKEEKERRALEKARQDLAPESLETSEPGADNDAETPEGRQERTGKRSDRNERRKKNHQNQNRRQPSRNPADTEPTAEELKQREALIAAAEAAAYDEL